MRYGSTLDACLARQAAEGEHGAAGPDELERELPRLGRAGRLDHDVGALAVAGLGAEERRERAPLGPAADADGPAAGVGDAGAEHQPDRPEADHRDTCRRRETPAASTPCRQQASGSTIAASSAGMPGGTGRRLMRAMRSGTRTNSA